MRQTILHTIIGRLTERHSDRTEKAEEEMTPHQQQSEALYKEWTANDPCFKGRPEDMKDFAAFCLERTGKEIPILIGNAREEACKVREHTAIDWVFRKYVDEEYSEEAVSRAVDEFREFRK